MVNEQTSMPGCYKNLVCPDCKTKLRQKGNSLLCDTCHIVCCLRVLPDSWVSPYQRLTLKWREKNWWNIVGRMENY